MAIFTTKACPVCRKTSNVTLTDEELKALRSDDPRPLPNRDVKFRKLVFSGTHEKCWHWLYGEGAMYA